MKLKCWLFFFLALLSTKTTLLNAQDNKPKRPRIGLVLSGGGAKGFVHIGVLKVLEEIGMPVDYITGTSMGSVVGGLYSCGYSSAHIGAIFSKINWEEVLSDKVSRRNISIEEKDDYGRYFSEFPMVKGKVVIPTALVDGQKISMLLSHYTWQAHTVSNFDSLPIPFRCIATDIEKLEPVVLKRGFLPDAIRASMAIPSFFKPIELDGKLLVDGGIVRNFPVQDAKEMGADIIIGVEVSAGLYNKSQLSSFFQIMDQISSIEAVRSNAKQEAMCNILIKPDMQMYNMFSFDKIDSLILLGEMSARKILPQLKSLADSLNKLEVSNKRRLPPRELDSIYIKSIYFEGLEKVSKNLIKGNFDIKDTGWTKANELEKGVDRLYGTRFFEKVIYKINPEQDGSILTLRFKEQTFSHLNMGFRYDRYQKTVLLLNATFRNMLGNGSRLLFDLKISEYPGCRLQYSIHTFAHPNIGIGLNAAFNSFPARFYNANGLLQDNFTVNHYMAELDIFSSFSKSLLFQSGLQGEVYDIKKDVEVNDTININSNALNFYTRIRFDTQNAQMFATKGDNFSAELKYVIGTKYFNQMNWDHTFGLITANYIKYIPLSKKIVIIPSFSLGFTFKNDIPYTYYKILGETPPFETNCFSFDGLKYMSVLSTNAGIVRLNFRVEPFRNKYITLKANYAQIADNMSNFLISAKNYFAIGLSGGLKTILGPLEISISKSISSRDYYGEIKFGYLF